MPITSATNAEYDAHLALWTLTERMLTGEGAEKELRRGNYEPKAAFKRRKASADWRPYTRDLISRLTGELFGRAEEVERSAPVPGEWLAAAGSEGESYEVQLLTLAETLVAYHDAWAIVDPKGPTLHVARPQSVPRWTEEAVVVKGRRAVPGDISEDERVEETWTVYRPAGYEVYTRDKDKDVLVGSGAYDEQGRAFTRQGRPTPPAFRIRLPWTVRFGAAVAKAHRALYRLESKYDAALSDALRGMIQLGTAGDEQFAGELRDALEKGALAVPYNTEYGEHRPLSVGTEGLPFAQDALEAKRRELYRVANQSLEEASTQMSATEAAFRNQSGSAAALSVLASAMESAEEEILRLAAQAHDARLTERAFDVSVSWPRDFSEVRLERD